MQVTTPDGTQRDGSRKTHVLVIGAGLACFYASPEALASGREVVLLEKQEAVGGSTVLRSGATAFAGPEEQGAAEISDGTPGWTEGRRRNDADAARHQKPAYDAGGGLTGSAGA